MSQPELAASGLDKQQGTALNLAIVAGVELGSAILLGAFLLSDATWVIVALLGLMAAMFAVWPLQKLTASSPFRWTLAGTAGLYRYGRGLLTSSFAVLVNPELSRPLSSINTAGTSGLSSRWAMMAVVKAAVATTPNRMLLVRWARRLHCVVLIRSKAGTRARSSGGSGRSLFRWWCHRLNPCRAKPAPTTADSRPGPSS